MINYKSEQNRKTQHEIESESEAFAWLRRTHKTRSFLSFMLKRSFYNSIEEESATESIQNAVLLVKLISENFDMPRKIVSS